VSKDSDLRRQAAQEAPDTKGCSWSPTTPSGSPWFAARAQSDRERFPVVESVDLPGGGKLVVTELYGPGEGG